MKDEKQEIKNVKLYISLGPLYILRPFLNYSSYPQAELSALGVQDSYNYFQSCDHDNGLCISSISINQLCFHRLI